MKRGITRVLDQDDAYTGDATRDRNHTLDDQVRVNTDQGAADAPPGDAPVPPTYPVWGSWAQGDEEGGERADDARADAANTSPGGSDSDASSSSSSPPSSEATPSPAPDSLNLSWDEIVALGKVDEWI